MTENFHWHELEELLIFVKSIFTKKQYEYIFEEIDEHGEYEEGYLSIVYGILS